MWLPKKLGYRSLAKLLSRPQIRVDALSRELDRRRARYISFSKVTCLEFCPYRYVLEYVKLKRLRPEPSYFMKGRLFHQGAAKFYEAKRSGPEPASPALHTSANRRLNGKDKAHVLNALKLLAEHSFKGWDVAAIESPFVLYLGPDLPPCIGIADLILRKGTHFAIVDHKTGKTFNKPDPLQLVIYREHIFRKYKARKCTAILDQYRWVRDLEHIRKPAFKRSTCKLGRNAWNRALKRIRSAHEEIVTIEREQDAAGTGSCFICPYKWVCPKARMGFFDYY
jgi:hypothetical protein